jgi:hypothetical protein
MRRNRKQENKAFDIDTDVIVKAMGAWKTVMDTAIKTIADLADMQANAAAEPKKLSPDEMYREIRSNLDDLSDEAIIEMHQVMSRHLSKNSTT